MGSQGVQTASLAQKATGANCTCCGAAARADNGACRAHHLDGPSSVAMGGGGSERGVCYCVVQLMSWASSLGDLLLWIEVDLCPLEVGRGVHFCGQNPHTTQCTGNHEVRRELQSRVTSGAICSTTNGRHMQRNNDCRQCLAPPPPAHIKRFVPTNLPKCMEHGTGNGKKKKREKRKGKKKRPTLAHPFVGAGAE